jgi:triphosphoribosyl-dephospho-CoA synthetase
MNARTLRLPRKRRTAADHLRKCEAWNDAHPVGTAVILSKDSGEQLVTKTRSAAMMAEAGYPVIFLEGVSGYYLLDRVRRALGEDP